MAWKNWLCFACGKYIFWFNKMDLAELNLFMFYFQRSNDNESKKKLTKNTF